MKQYNKDIRIKKETTSKPFCLGSPLQNKYLRLYKQATSSLLAETHGARPRHTQTALFAQMQLIIQGLRASTLH